MQGEFSGVSSIHCLVTSLYVDKQTSHLPYLYIDMHIQICVRLGGICLLVETEPVPKGVRNH